MDKCSIWDQTPCKSDEDILEALSGTYLYLYSNQRTIESLNMAGVEGEPDFTIKETTRFYKLPISVQNRVTESLVYRTSEATSLGVENPQSEELFMLQQNGRYDIPYDSRSQFEVVIERDLDLKTTYA